MRVKMSKQPPTRTYCKRNRPLPYCHQNCRTPRHWKLTQDHRTTRPPPSAWKRLLFWCTMRVFRYPYQFVRVLFFPFNFKGGMWGLIVLITDHYLSIYLKRIIVSVKSCMLDSFCLREERQSYIWFYLIIYNFMTTYAYEHIHVPMDWT